MNGRGLPTRALFFTRLHCSYPSWFRQLSWLRSNNQTLTIEVGCSSNEAHGDPYICKKLVALSSPRFPVKKIIASVILYNRAHCLYYKCYLFNFFFKCSFCVLGKPPINYRCCRCFHCFAVYFACKFRPSMKLGRAMGKNDHQISKPSILLSILTSSTERDGDLWHENEFLSLCSGSICTVHIHLRIRQGRFTVLRTCSPECLFPVVVFQRKAKNLTRLYL